MESDAMDSAVALETRSISKKFGGIVAADNIDFKVYPGELRCLIGPNGAGKSTLFSILCGFQQAESGEILIFGQNVTKKLAFERVRLGVGLTFQTNRAFHDLSVRENLAIPHFALKKDNIKVENKRLDYALGAFGLDLNDPTKAGELTHDQLQWLEMSMALSSNPNILLLDEPTAGMAEEETSKTGKVLKFLNSIGLTIVVVEHDMDFVRNVAQSVTVLHQGRIFAEGSVEEITSNEEVKQIYLGKG